MHILKKKEIEFCNLKIIKLNYSETKCVENDDNELLFSSTFISNKLDSYNSVWQVSPFKMVQTLLNYQRATNSVILNLRLVGNILYNW